MFYLAQIYFKIENGHPEREQFDCQLRLIQAENSEEAFFIARATAINEEIVFENVNNENIRWKFEGITDLRPIDISVQGNEIFTSTVETLKKERFDEFISVKNKDLAFQISKNELISSL